MNDRELEEINHILTDVIALDADALDIQVPEDARTRMLANIKRRAQAPAPEGTQTVRAADINWEDFRVGVQRKCIVPDHGDGTQTCVYRLQPGATLPSHKHTHQETCWVISGDVLVGEHPLHAGDMHIAEVDYRHPEILARTEALLLIRSQTYTGPLSPA